MTLVLKHCRCYVCEKLCQRIDVIGRCVYSFVIYFIIFAGNHRVQIFLMSQEPGETMITHLKVSFLFELVNFGHFK